MINLIRKLLRMHTPSTPHSRARKPGQAMVEFALALPILLMVTYGLLEAGRLIFIYSSTVTAARQAVRYGSTIGINDDGVPYYRDCAGIENAATRVGFINTFDDVSITYDRGPGGTNGVAIPGVNPDPTVDTCSSMNDNTLQNGDRIKVLVSTDWSPIISVSRLIPSFQPFTITSQAERTILTSVEINVPLDGSGGTWGGQTGTLALSVTKSSNTYSYAGEVITYTYTLTNSHGSFSTTGPFTITDNRVAVDCSGAAGSLAPGATTTCTGSLTITQPDLDAGSINHTAVANGSGVTSNSVPVTLTATQYISLTLEKTVTPTIATVAGTTVTYTYTLVNSGNVTLQSPYTVSDNIIPSNQIDCTGAASTIAPGDYIQCTASYVITAADVSNGSVTNTATARAIFNSAQVTSNTATAKVETSLLTLNVFASPSNVTTLNQKITYSYVLKNNSSSATITGPYAIVDNRSPVNLSCPSGSIAPSGSITCTGDYFVTQADLDAGSITNQAYATAVGGTMTSGLKITTVSVTQTAVVSLSINPPSPLPTPIVADTVINYNYVITNAGNVTLTSPFLVNEFNLGVSPTCPATSTLAPSATITCTLAYTVKASDISKNIITSVAIAYAKAGTQEIASTQKTNSIVITSGPRLDISIEAPATYNNSGQVLSIKFILRNTGSTNLAPPYSISANAFLGQVTCDNLPTVLEIGQEAYCYAAYITKQTPDLTTGYIDISATAKAMNNGSELVSWNTATKRILSNFSCSISVAKWTIDPRQNIALDLISSINSTGTATIKTIQLRDWDYKKNRYITALYLLTKTPPSETTIATGGAFTETGNPPWWTFTTSNASIEIDTRKTLRFNFNFNYGKIRDETVTITFHEAGCGPYTFNFPP